MDRASTVDTNSARIAAARTAWLSRAAFRLLQRARHRQVTEPRDLVLRPDYVVPEILWHRVVFSIEDTYGINFRDTVFDNIIPHLQRSVERMGGSASIPAINERIPSDEAVRAALPSLHSAFLSSPVDVHAVDQLERDVTDCWRAFRDRAPPGSFPFIAVVKDHADVERSRLLYELAVRTTTPPSSLGRSSHLRVLYVCVREEWSSASTRFPVATPCLHGYLFPNDVPIHDDEDKRALTAKLCRLFEFAVSHWDDIAVPWLSLFTDPAADRSVCMSLEDAAGRFITTHVVGQRDRRPCDAFADRRVVVVVVDDAATLVVEHKKTQLCWLRTLRRALKAANRSIGKRFGTYAGVLVVTADASRSIVHCMLPPTDRVVAMQSTVRQL